MPVTREQVLSFLGREEMDYVQAAETLGAEALPALRQIIDEGPTPLAAKATYLVGYIEERQDAPSTDAADAVRLAAESAEPVLRVAAAGALRHFSRPPVELLDRLLQDADAGVRKLTLQRLEQDPLPEMEERVRRILEEEPSPRLRDIARRITDKIR